MKDAILKKLNAIEKEHEVRILYAVESGSRAWGFASKDSDYDVRFIYIHQVDWYLSLEEKRDVIEYPGKVLDISGWDIRKALKLFKKSNPPLYEWLRSPIIYRESDDFIQKLRALQPQFYSPISSIYHYLHMAKGNYREYLKGETVRIKKYFYVLRPILACLWIEKQKTVPPMEFEKLLYAQALDKELLKEIETLLSRKKSSEELAVEKKIEIINTFLEERIKYIEAHIKELKIVKPGKSEQLDMLFREMIKYCD